MSILRGPYHISHAVYLLPLPGVYVLSRRGGADYVGRSDTDLRGRLISSARLGSYRYFWFQYAPSAMRAFKCECELFHRFNPPENAVHPAAPAGTFWRCPAIACPWGPLPTKPSPPLWPLLRQILARRRAGLFGAS